MWKYTTNSLDDMRPASDQLVNIQLVYAAALINANEPLQSEEA